MYVMRDIVKWCDKKMEEAFDEKDERKAYEKAIASGAVEGFCNAAIIMYVPVLVACYVWKHKASKK